MGGRLDDEVVGACSTHGREMLTFLLESLEERDHVKDLGVEGKVILEWILEK
jgi:hypothetical protein